MARSLCPVLRISSIFSVGLVYLRAWLFHCTVARTQTHNHSPRMFICSYILLKIELIHSAEFSNTALLPNRMECK